MQGLVRGRLIASCSGLRLFQNSVQFLAILQVYFYVCLLGFLGAGASHDFLLDWAFDQVLDYVRCQVLCFWHRFE